MYYVQVSFCSISLGLIVDTYCNPFCTLSHHCKFVLNNPIDMMTVPLRGNVCIIDTRVIRFTQSHVSILHRVSHGNVTVYKYEKIPIILTSLFFCPALNN